MTAALRHRVLAIGEDPGDSSDLRFRKRLLVGIALLILPAGLVWGSLYWAIGEEGVALTPWGYVAGSIVSLGIFARTRSLPFLRTAQLALILVAPALGMIMLGGFEDSSFVILWSLLAPLGAVAFDRPERAWPWFAAFVSVVLLALVLGEVVRPDGASLPDGFVRTFDVLNVVGVSLVAMVLLVTFARGRDTAQARVEALLLNILPEEVAERLQTEPHAIADHFEDASILFADVVDFTPLASRLDAREVVGLLDRLFTSFDDLVDRYQVEKIKTIGDCYMVAAGVPRPRPDHAHALAGLALEMRECAGSCLPESALRLRIGISSGPVVAGVIGRRRFLYDLWGNTVNMASRMESHGTSDGIQITRPTWELLRDDFATERIGLVEVKGKGEVETWRLVGRNEGGLRSRLGSARAEQAPVGGEDAADHAEAAVSERAEDEGLGLERIELGRVDGHASVRHEDGERPGARLRPEELADRPHLPAPRGVVLVGDGVEERPARLRPAEGEAGRLERPAVGAREHGADPQPETADVVADRLRLHAPTCREVALRAAVGEHDGVLVGLREVGSCMAEDEDEPAPLQLGGQARTGARGARGEAGGAEHRRDDGEREAPARRCSDRADASSPLRDRPTLPRSGVPRA
jgi:guanylate cyclase